MRALAAVLGVHQEHRGNTVSYVNQTHAVRTTRDMPDVERSQRVQGGRKADAVRACTTRPRKMGVRQWLRIYRYWQSNPKV